MADRVRRPLQYGDFLNELTRDRLVFKTYKDALMFAACLGYSRGKRVPFDKTAEPINLHTFSGKFDEMVMNTLAVAELNDPYVMGEDREDEKIRIFEEYACGGLEILDHELGQGSLTLDEGLLKIIMEEDETEGILTEITGLGNL